MNKEFTNIRFKDVTMAFGGIKQAVLKNKGKYNNAISAMLFQALEEAGIPTSFVEIADERTQKCLKCDIIPLQIIVRNRLAGTTAEILGMDNGTAIPNTIYEIRYDNEELGCPMINRHHAIALGLASNEEIEEGFMIVKRMNEVLKDIFMRSGIELVDFKTEMGRTSEGRLVITGGITPDHSRLWDIATGEVLDKDRFRHDLSDVCASYKEVMERLQKTLAK